VEDRRSHTIGIVLPTWSNPFYHRILRGVESAEEAEQVLFFYCLTHDDPIIAWREIARLIAKGVDGLLIVSHDIGTVIETQRNHEQLTDIPYVSLDVPGVTGYAVQVDLYSAGYQATKHLIDRGHRRIGLITYYKDVHNVKPINQGYIDAIQNEGIEIDPGLCSKVSGFEISEGEVGMQYLLQLDDPPSAVFAITDLLAIGAMKFAKDLGLQIPEDLAIVGFNNISLGEIVEPSLTTVSAPSEALGREAIKMLGQLINGAIPSRREVVLPTTLIIRKSSGRSHS
jgi:DNA-binding LacI/PurR family transcriptional regulator